MSRTKEHKPLTVSDLRPCVDGQFTDSYGNVVKHGSRIIIESTYSLRYMEGQEALVEWDGKKGMYNYILVDDWMKSRSNFYGIAKFKIKENDYEQIQTNQNQAMREVPLESFNQSA